MFQQTFFQHYTTLYRYVPSFRLSKHIAGINSEMNSKLSFDILSLHYFQLSEFVMIFFLLLDILTLWEEANDVFLGK